MWLRSVYTGRVSGHIPTSIKLLSRAVSETYGSEKRAAGRQIGMLCAAAHSVFFQSLVSSHAGMDHGAP